MRRRSPRSAKFPNLPDFNSFRLPKWPNGQKLLGLTRLANGQNLISRSFIESIQSNSSYLYQPTEVAKVGLIGLLAGLAIFNFNTDSENETDYHNLPKKPENIADRFKRRPYFLNSFQPVRQGKGRLFKGNKHVTKIALGLVPKGLRPVSIFPPYEKKRMFAAVSVIFQERNKSR